MSEEDESNFRKATRCHICQIKFRDNDGPNEEPVRDHCHVTGKYRGSAHKKCKLKLKISAERIKIPVIFHNLTVILLFKKLVNSQMKTNLFQLK